MTDALQADGVALIPDALIALRPLALRLPGAVSLAQRPGGFAGRRKGQGQEVADLREYQPGDDIRHMDRAATARTGRPHPREFQQDRDRVSLLVVDFRPPMLWGVSRALMSVAAAEIACLIGWRAIEDGGRVGLLLLTSGAPVIVAPRGRVRGMLGIIGALCRAHAEALAQQAKGTSPTPAMDRALDPVERLCPSGSDVYILSGFEAEGPALDDRLGTLRRFRGLHLVALTDAQDLPPGRYPVQTDAGGAQTLSLQGALRLPDSIDIAGQSAPVLCTGHTPQAMVDRLGARP